MSRAAAQTNASFYSAVPEELRARRQWVSWWSVVGEGKRVKLPNGKLTSKPLKKQKKPHKLPLNPHTGAMADTTKPATWGAFEEAVAAAEKWSLTGVGFVFSDADPYSGVDLDDCRNPDTGEIAEWAWEIIRGLNSYTEVSLSGTGVHIIPRGELPAGEGNQAVHHGGKVEMFSRARYFTFTGTHVDRTPTEILDRQTELLALHKKLFAGRSIPNVAEYSTPASPLMASDDELITKAQRAQNGPKFERLWNGQWEGDYPSQSEADLALCCLLAFWTRKDRARIDGLFRRSGMMRKKWLREDYRADTLSRAIAITGETWRQGGSMPQNEIAQGGSSQSGQRSDPPEPPDPLDAVTETEIAAQEWAQRFHDKPLTINLSARLPEGRFNGWLEADACFRNTWYRQRPDLEDQSQQSYDFALARFGCTAGLTEQEIVDLIIHHRALHKQKVRTTLDYFQRIISKAASHTDNQFPRPANSRPSNSENRQGSSATEPDRAEICQKLSALFGVQIHSLTKIKGQSPIYHMELAEGKAEFNVGKLMSQTAVRNTLAGIAGKLMPRFKTKEWEKIAQALLDACTVEEGGEEMEMEGSARLRLIQYLSATAFIDSLDGQSRDNARKPMVADGIITVCSSDIQTFINKTTTESVTIPAVVGMLSAVGAKSRRFRGNFPEQSRWMLPTDKFGAADYVISTGEEPSDDSQ